MTHDKVQISNARKSHSTMMRGRRGRKRRHDTLAALEELDAGELARDCGVMKRRRLAAGVMALMLTVVHPAVVQTALAGGGTREDSVTLRREQVEFDLWCSTMASTLFLQMFRMSKPLFMKLVDIIRADVATCDWHATCATGRAVPVEVKLGITLRWLFGGSYLDACAMFRVAKSSTIKWRWAIMRALYKHLHVRMPTDQATLLRYNADWLRKQAYQVFTGIVGAVDGILIKIRCPSAAEAAKPAKFWCRKGYYSVNMQAVVDAHGRFIFVAVDMPGSSHDATAFRYSELYRHIEQGVYDGFYFLADAAYRCVGRMLTPFVGALTDEQSVFSFFHSSLRVTVERSFGQLVARFGILWRPLSCAHRRVPLVLNVCCALHNWLLDNNEPIILQPPSGRNSVRQHERPYLNADDVPEDMLPDNDADVQGGRRLSGMEGLRDRLAREMFHDRIMRRPYTRGDAVARGAAR